MMEYEVRLLPDDECIIFVRGEEPLRDKKWFPWEHEEYERARSYGYYIKPDFIENEEIEFISEASLEYQKKMAEKDPRVRITSMDPVDFMMMDLEQLQNAAGEELEDDAFN